MMGNGLCDGPGALGRISGITVCLPTSSAARIGYAFLYIPSDTNITHVVHLVA